MRRETTGVTLPPGDYVMDVDRREHGHVRAKSQAFTIIANQTVRVDSFFFPAG